MIGMGDLLNNFTTIYSMGPNYEFNAHIEMVVPEFTFFVAISRENGYNDAFMGYFFKRGPICSLEATYAQNGTQTQKTNLLRCSNGVQMIYTNNVNVTITF